MRSSIAVLPFAVLILVSPVAAAAQTTVEGRVGRLEQEMRAVQRKVFPDGAGKYLQPQVTAPAVPGAVTGTPASSQVADLTSRVSAVEAQLRTLTGQVEQNSFKVRQLEQAFAQYKADMAAAAGAPVAALPAISGGAAAAARSATPPAAATKPAPASSSSDARKVAVAAIERPDTGDEAEDAYTYGFRLWNAKFFPEAQVQLKATVDKFSGASIASRAQNLLGRAYLDDSKYALASVAFYENYQKRPKGERAADSLAYLGESLIQLKKLPDACKVFQEFGEVYGEAARAELKTMVDKGKARAKCSA